MQKKFEDATDSTSAITKEARYNISKSDLVRTEEKLMLELSDEELENVSEGTFTVTAVLAAGTITIADTAETSIASIVFLKRYS